MKQNRYIVTSLHRYIVIVASAGLLALMPACSALRGTTASTTPIISPATSANVVVTAEKTLRVSKDTTGLFLHLEKDNQTLFDQISGGKSHEFAQMLRRNFPTWLENANTLKNAYKHGGAGVTEQQLLSALAKLTENTAQAQAFLTQFNLKKAQP